MAALLLVALAVAHGQGTDTEAYREYCEALRKEQVAAARSELKQLQDTYRKKRRSMKPADARALTAKLKTLPKEISALKHGPPPTPTIRLDKPLKIGQIGTLSTEKKKATPITWWLIVLQVPSDGEALIKSRHGSWKDGSLGTTPGPPVDGPMFWFSAIDTSHMTTGQKIWPRDIFKVVGTKTYPTAGGATRTVFVLRRLDLSQSPATSPPDTETPSPSP